ncbi:copper homeostasis protein CutC [Nitrospirillum amazonense]|uniref:copper homeostasis protein CutC n=1 Tax=Nitrospirillum amazonense TaxID=28077 RepID=UPI0024126B59|nr:copper homeostasis protein CutC [Nitrospirillum amazonense]MDG3442222.1 copper homeostasis protein CutC [Nitrospirillum amazonense]
MTRVDANRVRLEVCVDSPAGVAAAIKGGANRLELCAALVVGGLTPSRGLMALAAASGRPAYAMIRPRPGDFVYGPADLDVMGDDIDTVRALGLPGVVLGASLPSGELDAAALSILVDRAGGLGMTLHRAIDLTPDPIEALDIAIELGFERVLTSGGARTAVEGAETIAELVDHAQGRISIMAGSGVTPDNAVDLIRQTGVAEVHASCGMAPAVVDQHLLHFGFVQPGARETDAATVMWLAAAIRDIEADQWP